jgi:hypothetical protein
VPDIRFAPRSRISEKDAWLLKHARNENSQFGEDGIIAEVLRIIGTENKWCVEAGAWDGKHFSNTHALMQTGWNGVLIEANDTRVPTLIETYAGNERALIRQAFIGLDEGVNNLDYLLSETPIPRDFDLLSLDIDSIDYHVWAGLTDYRPRLVVIEFNPTVPNEVIFIQDRNAQINHGASLAALIELGKSKHYELVCATDVNGFFVDAPLFERFQIADNSIDALHWDKHTARIFQGYDGTIFTAGMPRLLWSQRPVEFEELQVLPPEERRYRD